MKKKILIFSTAYFPFVGGAEIAVKEITDRIGSDFDFDMITLNLDGKQSEREMIGNVNVYRIGKEGRFSKLLFPFKASKFAKRLHKKKNYDAIWSIMASYSGFAALFFKKRFKQVPFILTLQEGDDIRYIENKVRFVKKWFKEIFLFADTIQTISYFLASWARKVGYKGHIEVIPNAVDTAHFSKEIDNTELENLKRLLGKGQDDVLLITTSRLVVKNGIDDLISSLSYLSSNIKLLILGQGSEESKLKKLVDQSKLSQRVQFLGFVSHAEIPKYLKASDVFIRPSLSEGMGNSFIEAMAAGIPVIATEVGGIPDFLFDPDKNPEKASTGLFANVRDPQSIAKQVKRFLEKPALRTQIVLNAQRMVLEKYDWNLIAKNMKEKVFDV